jgi:hypothetical protein
VDGACRLCKSLERAVGGQHGRELPKAHAERCRSLAENADEFTKRRLLDLAAKYDKRLTAAGPSAATRIPKAPIDLVDAPKLA